MKTRLPITLIALLLLLSSVAPAAAQQGTIGMVVDDPTDSAIVFDAQTDTVLGAVPVGPDLNGDCSITHDQTLGFVTAWGNGIWVIDLTTSPPSLASGTNPIPISNNGEDTTITPNQRFLVVSDGSLDQPISVIDIASRTEISTFSLGHDHNSVEVLSDASVLATSTDTLSVHRLTIDDAGNLMDTGDALPSGGWPSNAYGAPGARSGIVVKYLPYPGEIRSFTIPGLTLVDTRSLTGGLFGISGLVNPAGDRVYARSNGGAVDVFDFNPATGALGAAPLFSIPILDAPAWYGMEQMALTPSGNKLYVSQPGALNVYGADTGALLTSITHPDILGPTGVCFPAPGTPPPPVGGHLVPVSKSQLLAPWVALAAMVSLILAGGPAAMRKRRC
jgi:hypothetical protein